MKTITHQSKLILEDNFSKEIAEKLQVCINKYGHASLLVSGGSTPIGLYKKLSTENINWEKVTIGLVDERFVPSDHTKSNEKLIRENLLINNASSAQFLGLVYDINSKTINLVLAEKIYSHFRARVDVSILGMGSDGHTASLFPTDSESKIVLGENYHDLVANTKADVEPIERITCSRSLLFKSSNLYLMITGEEKLKVLKTAKEKSLPISFFFETPTTNLVVYYTQK